MNLKPMNDRVIVKRQEEAPLSTIIQVPDSAKEKPLRGIVHAVGPKCEHVKVGDMVVFGKYTGNDIKHDGVDYLAIKEEDIFAVVG